MALEGINGASRQCYVRPSASPTRAGTGPEPYSFVLLGLAWSENQIRQVVEKIGKPKERMEGLESSVLLIRQRHLTPVPFVPVGEWRWLQRIEGTSLI